MPRTSAGATDKSNPTAARSAAKPTAKTAPKTTAGKAVSAAAAAAKSSAKTAAGKTPPKTPAAKKANPGKKAGTAVKAQSEKYLARVPEEVIFWCHDGQVFRDLAELIEGFDRMTDEIFNYHANDRKNDFSCWIIDIIGDVELGINVKNARSRRQAKEVAQQRYYDLTRLEG